MQKSVIKIENLSKEYRFGIIGHGTLYKDLQSWWAQFRGKEDPNSKVTLHSLQSSPALTGERFWALKDISFDVKEGEVLGIIGRNGAGKSTLLKILSRVTTPTQGQVKIRGRISSLLEIGTGFHPELTGRENVYLNGMIHGMTKAEIKKKFDEIVDFSGIEKFIDTPAKRYSSGMKVRLGFAVAAHLEPEILVVDEVLAVGDVEFQKKCLGKMREISLGGRTVLFVSHNMQAIRSLCTSAILIEDGIASDVMTPEDCICKYLECLKNDTVAKYPIVTNDFILHSFNVSQKGLEFSDFSGDESIDLNIDIEILKDTTLFRLGFVLKNQFGEIISSFLLADWDKDYENMQKGRYRLETNIPAKTLFMSDYVVEVYTGRYGVGGHDLSCTAVDIKVSVPSGYNAAHPTEKRPGYFLWNGSYSFENID